MRKQAARGVLWAFLQTTGQRMMTFFIFLVLARVLDPAAFGLVALASVYISFIELFLNVGFADAIVQRKDLRKGHLNTAFWVLLGVGVVGAAVAYFSAGYVSKLFGREDLAPIIQGLTPAIIFISLTRVQAGLLRRDLRFKSLAIRTLSATAAGGIAGITMALNGFGVWSLVAQQLTEGAVSVLVLWLSSSWRPNGGFSRARFSELFGFGGRVMGANMMRFASQQADRLLVGYFLGAIMLGYYMIGVRLVVIIQQLLGKTISMVMYSLFARVQADIEKLRSSYIQVTQLTAFMVIPAFVYIAVAGEQLVVVLFGDKWLPSAPVVQVLAVSAALQSMLTYNDPVMKACNRPGWSLKVATLRVLLTVPLILYAVDYGLVAVAIAWVIREAIILPVSMLLVDKLVGLSLKKLFQMFLAPVSGAIVAGLVLYWMQSFTGGHDAMWTMPAGLLVTAVTYLAVVFIMERQLIFRSINAVKTVIART